MAAHGFHIGRAAGRGHEAVTAFHAFHEFRGLALRGHVRAQGHFHDIGKAQTAQGRDDAGRAAGELAHDGRSHEGRHMAAAGQGAEHGQHLAALHDRPEGTGTHAAAAAGALFKVDLGTALVALVDGAHRAGRLAGDVEAHDGMVGAGVHAHAAVAALVGVDGGAAAGEGDGPEAAAADTGTRHAALAGIGHIVAGPHAALAGDVADRQDGPVGFRAFQGLFGIGAQRDGVVRLVFEAEAHGGAQALAQDGAVLVDAAAAHDLAAARAHQQGDAVHVFRQGPGPERTGQTFDDAEAQRTQHIVTLGSRHGLSLRRNARIRMTVRACGR